MPPLDATLNAGTTADLTGDRTASSTQPERQPRPFWAMVVAGVISLIGNQLTGLAVPWFVLQTTGSAGLTGLAAIAGMIPMILATFFGGAVVDRLGARRMSIVSDLLSGVTVALIPLLYHTVGLPFAVLLALVFLGALLDAPGGTARQTLLPDLAALARLRLERANGITGTMYSLAQLIGPPLAGVLVAVLGPSHVLWLDAGTFAISAAAVAAFVPRPKPKPSVATEGQSLLADLKEGMLFLRREPVLWGIAITAAAVNFFFTINGSILLPVYANKVLESSEALGVIFGGFGAGALVGGLVYSWIGHHLPRRLVLIGGLFIAQLPIWYLAAYPGAIWVALSMVLLGLSIGPINPLVGTIMQERIPPEFRGRVFGAISATAMVISPLGIGLASVLLEIFSIRVLSLALGIGILAVCCSMLLNPAFRNLNPPDATIAN